MRSFLVVRSWAIALVLFFMTPSGTTADVPDPTVEGPIAYSAGSWGFPWSSVPDLAELSARGYIEQEFLFSGTVGTQPYTSRMICTGTTEPTSRRSYRPSIDS
jgi:hypothetical protein